MSDEKELEPLSPEHQIVLNEYLKCWNKTRAYKKGFPKSSDEVARTMACRLFANANMKAHVQARLDESHMSADEALKMLAEIAHGKEPAKRVVETSAKGEIETLTYDPIGALDKILRVHGKYQDNLDIKLPEVITVKLVKSDDAN